MASSDDGFSVRLYVYDMSQGMAQMLSQQIVGTQIDGIWHTGVQVYNHEYFYGGGIQSGIPGQTPYGSPVRVVEMGRTFIPQDVFHEFLREVSPRFAPDKYSLLKWNCNNFSHEVCQFLLSKGVPDFVIGLPDRFIQTPFGQMMKPQFDQMEAQMKMGFGGILALEPNLPPILDEDRIRDITPPSTAVVMAYDAFVGKQKAQHDALEHQVNTMLGGAPPATSSPTHASAPPTAVPRRPAPAVTSRVEPDVTVADDEKSAVGSLMAKLYRSTPHPHRRLSLRMLASAEFLRPVVTNDKNLEMVASLIIKDVPMDEACQKQIKSLVKYAQSGGTTVVDGACFASLDRLLNSTDPTKLLGLVSLWRCVVLYDQGYYYFENFETIQNMIAKLGLGAEARSSVGEDMTKLVVLLVLGHMYCHVRQFDEHLLDICLEVFETSSSGNVRLGAARLLFNMSVQLPRETSDAVARMAASLTDRVLREPHAATRFRCLATIAVLAYCNSSVAEFLVDLEFDADDVDLTTKRLKQIGADLRTILGN